MDASLACLPYWEKNKIAITFEHQPLIAAYLNSLVPERPGLFFGLWPAIHEKVSSG